MNYDIESPIEVIKELLPANADILKKSFNIFKLNDLLTHYPYRYIDKSKVYTISEITETINYIQIYATIVNISTIGEGKKKRLEVIISDKTGSSKLIWFQSIDWIKKNLKLNKKYLIFGKPQKFGLNYTISHPEMKQIDELTEVELKGFVPIYNTSEVMKKRGLDSKGISNLIKNVFNIIDHTQYDEYLSEDILRQYNFISFKRSIYLIHFPNTLKDIEDSLYRLKFDEFFKVQFRLYQTLRKRKTKSEGFYIEKIGDKFNTFFHECLPFELTSAQKRVLKEIRKDLASKHQMNRLLQGDVGSGKTIVALMTILMTLDNGFQGCLMAPTEILSNQHFENIKSLTQTMNIRIELLTGSITPKNKKIILDDLKHGKIDILVGTHALIEPTVEFKNLGLVVIDEQHRFGVEQRAKLWNKNTLAPHVLVMTATPIPRTLAMTMYGDLDYSIIDELPPGRIDIKTSHVYFTRKNELYNFLKLEIEKGHQVYIIFPLIEESEKIDLKCLEVGYSEICEYFPSPKYTVAKVHGKMKSQEKEEQMNLFVTNQAQILVGTTVIEVGVNVPNATIMVIMEAQRFGLSQLHQLRGRVGRGSTQSFCILMTDFNLSTESKNRLKIMENTNNGFKISEEDLKLRGPGDISGTRQSGDIHFKLASISEDQHLLILAQKISSQIQNEDSELELEKNKNLKRYIQRIHSKNNKWDKIS